MNAKKLREEILLLNKILNEEEICKIANARQMDMGLDTSQQFKKQGKSKQMISTSRRSSLGSEKEKESSPVKSNQ
jgi:hypothetical protein